MNFVRKHKKVLLICLVVALIGTPITINYLLEYIPGNGSNDGWLGFWGSYFGAIFSALIAYAIAYFQIFREQTSKRDERVLGELPYFNIGETNKPFRYNPANLLSMDQGDMMSCPLVVSTSNMDIPLLNFEINKDEQGWENMGHVFPSSEYGVLNFFDAPSRVDIRCRTTDGINIFFTYGKGVNNMSAYYDQGKWKWYVSDTDSNTEEANKRLKCAYKSA